MFTNYKSGNKHHDFQANNNKEWVYSCIFLRLEGRGCLAGFLAEVVLLVVVVVEDASAALAAFKAAWKFL